MVPFDDPNVVAYNPLATTFMEVVAPNDDIHVTEKPWSEIITWMDDILINVMGQRVKTVASARRYQVPFAAVLFGVSALANGSVSPNSYSPSSVGDPHITSVTGEKFDLWKLG